MIIKNGLSTWEEKNCVFTSHRVLIQPHTMGYLLVYKIDALQMLGAFCLCENVPDFLPFQYRQQDSLWIQRSYRAC